MLHDIFWHVLLSSHFRSFKVDVMKVWSHFVWRNNSFILSPNVNKSEVIMSVNCANKRANKLKSVPKWRMRRNKLQVHLWSQLLKSIIILIKRLEIEKSISKNEFTCEHISSIIWPLGSNFYKKRQIFRFFWFFTRGY